LDEVIDHLNINKGDVVVDGTLGGGGYFREICKKVGNEGVVIGIDQDQKAIERVRSLKNKKNYTGILQNTSIECKEFLICENFRNLDKVLTHLNIEKIDAITLDIGLSSDQFEQSGRGFSFQKDEPLLMTMREVGSESSFTAKEIVNTWDEENIADILFGYGEEKASRKIARKIIEARKEKTIKTTFDLVEILEKALPVWKKRGKTHFATKTFQALRIAVNDELRALRDGLEKGFDALDTEGRMVAVSFHSLEDRIVKNFMRDKKNEKKGILINKKPIVPNKEEIIKNPRARSAKLRVIQKI